MSTRSKLLAKTGDLTLPGDAAAPEPAAPPLPSSAQDAAADAALAAAHPAAREPAQKAAYPVADQAAHQAAHHAASEAARAAPQAPAAPEALRFPPMLPGAMPRTGPGQMLQFRGQLLAAEGEVGRLREQLKEHDGAIPTRRLDPSQVLPSRWANRHPDAFNSPAFARLKQDIEAAGANVQPILVRPLAEQPGRYEIVFGHRRHRACAELGLPVLATIETAAVSEQALFSAMDRENRERADLSPYEQGVMYRRALDEKLYPSNRRLAEALGVSHTWVANVLMVADLPPPLLDCFRSPLEVQHRHARALLAALEQDRKAVLRRAEKFRQQPRKAAPQAVVAALTAAGPAEASATPQLLAVAGRPVGRWFTDNAGRLNIQIDAPAIGTLDHAELAKLLAAALGKA